MDHVKNSFINPKEIFNPQFFGFSHIAKIPEGKTLYYFSGQWASDVNGKLVSTDFEQQVRQTVSNIKKALAAAQLTLDEVVKQTVYIVDFTMEKKQILIDVAAQEWQSESYPASSIIPLPVLATAPNCLIEIEIIAASGLQPLAISGKQ
ncbi:enamine deaminase RidA (YjgF/YER057c/UK114 family) [Dyadobacter jejuensis]|uniref:Enamine deaminase RidA (YjgF/YER057c/UK114 family) n=1 Tax=Dyadobacter jejuensis TaxID=1082580 RepID=A0A316ADK7_9BACT|nr:RidA family protein [Dyadobacter jejuensis]PWJ55050.1 enamine deaminase RidA (YjgF/YER057c/UK114 family) [Dyadobacter jejuensis]